MSNLEMIIPPYLKSGDTIGITAPAKKISLEEISPAIKILESWGLSVKIGKTIGTEYHQFSGNDKARAEDFQEMLDDDSVKGVMCARGGYGCVRFVDRLDFSTFKQNPKWIIGFSDITVLHTHIHSNYQIQTLHSDMPIQFPKDGKENLAIETIKRCLFGENIQYHFRSDELNRLGEAKGQLIGGNLSLLYNVIGSKSDINTEGKILFIEDLDEYLYHVDRMIIGLKRAGKLSKLAGLVVGGMTDMNDNTVPFGKSAEEIIQEHTAEYDYPVCYHFPAGHIKGNHALKMGAEIELNVSENNYLKFL